MALALLIAACLLTVGCTQNQMARHYGGTSEMDLPVNKELVNITFKEANIWVLMKQREPGKAPRIYTFKEYSNWGVAEGTVVIREK